MFRKTTETDNERIINKVRSYRKTIFDKIERNKPDSLWLGSNLDDIKKIIIIASCSRSGSSLLFDTLKKLPLFYAPGGETVPFYKLSGWASDLYDSDEINAEILGNASPIYELYRDLMSDFAFSRVPRNLRNDEQVIEDYTHDLLLRFAIEWPTIDFNYDIFSNVVRTALDTNFNTFNEFMLQEFYLELLFFLTKHYREINPFYYDIPKMKLVQKFPYYQAPTGPPNETLIIEEPPFILVGPRRNVTKCDLNDQVLLLKDPVSSYRLKWLEKIFSNAEIKIIYLTRNPASSINGLYDGWLDRGFFSGNLKYLLQSSKNSSFKELNIKGYSDQAEWGKWWWNFDRPPYWENYIDSKLEEVCGFQWQANNEAILKYLQHTDKAIYRIKFEDIIRSVESRLANFTEIVKFIGFNGDIKHSIDLSNLPVIQATKNPRFARWKEREDIIKPILTASSVLETCAMIDYKIANIEEWI